MLEQYLIHIASSQLLTACSALMVILFLYDFIGTLGSFFGVSTLRRLDFKSSIVSLGIFGTFVGILGGLYGFNSQSITESVPQLLEGLKFAFATSVLGMALSVVLSILHRIHGEAESDQEILISIDNKIGDFNKSLTSLATSIESPQELIKQFSEMKDFLKSELTQINSSLEKALEQLGAGATKEVINALEQVIVEFNENLTTQFGENFKQLNEACAKLVDWQKQYKDHIDGTAKNLVIIKESLDQSSQSAESLVKSNHSVLETCKTVSALIKTYDLQIHTLEQYLSHCKTLGDEAKSFLTTTEHALKQSSQNMTTFSTTIEQSVGKQSQALATLTEDIDKQLPKALGELEDVLTNITNQFARDYKSLFEFVTSKK